MEECNEIVKDVRMLIPDMGYPPVFSNEQIERFLVLNDDDVYLAAADAVDAIATQVAFTGGATTIRTDDLTIQGKDNVTALFERSKSLRERSASAAGDFFDIYYPTARCMCYLAPEGSANPDCSCSLQYRGWL